MTKTVVEATTVEATIVEAFGVPASVPASSASSARAIVNQLSHQDTDFIINPHLSLRHETPLYRTPLYLREHLTGERNLINADSWVPTSISPPPSSMRVLGLNHFNITASPSLIEQVKRFYIDTVGLTIGPRAHLEHAGYWLYAGELPILHLSACQTMETDATTGKGYFNHISMSCVGLKAAIAKMIATQTPYRLIQLPDVHQTQIFLKDPAGIGVELTFFNECL